MKFILFLFLLSSYLVANKLEATYDIKYGIFGTLGNAITVLDKNEKVYNIRVMVKTVGFAKFISNNRQEIYESNGIVVDDILYPYAYKKTKITNSYKKIKEYIFNHETKKVILKKEEQYYDTNESIQSHTEYNFYAVNDILTLYFNLNKLIKRTNKNHFVFSAIGANRNDGRINVQRLKDLELEEVHDIFGKNSNQVILKVLINQDIFSSDKGEMIISINNDNNICNKAVLKDVLLFGDITGIKINSIIETQIYK